MKLHTEKKNLLRGDSKAVKGGNTTKKTWCPVCVGFVDYRTEEDMRDIEFDGIRARYNRKTAICPKCDTVLNVSDIINQNIRARIDALNEGAK